MPHAMVCNFKGDRCFIFQGLFWPVIIYIVRDIIRPSRKIRRVKGLPNISYAAGLQPGAVGKYTRT